MDLFKLDMVEEVVEEELEVQLEVKKIEKLGQHQAVVVAVEQDFMEALVVIVVPEHLLTGLEEVAAVPL
jgi:hypothetical protein